MRLLCLSNGHGEDEIAVRILQELQRHSDGWELVALPLVGEGRAYSQLGIPLVGPVQTMPSGGFIYMDGRQLVRDVRGGLVQLTLAQFKAVRQATKKGGAVLAVGDIVPLLFAWLSRTPYAFVGTAKSEYYLRDQAGPLPRKSWVNRWEGWSGSVYLPWERWLMSRRRCKAVFPRDSLTTQTLKNYSIPAFDLGNPMMDGIHLPTRSPFYDRDAELKEQARSLVIALLPGSRAPEAYDNWQTIVSACTDLMATFQDRSLVFLSAIAPGLDLDTLRQICESHGWCQPPSKIQPRVATNDMGDASDTINTLSAEPASPIADPDAMTLVQQQATLILRQQAFSECLHKADFAIAMAGTATEQFVGLGKPAIAIPGKGPQFTPVFAEAQSRLLGPSLILVDRPAKVAGVVQSLLRDPDYLQLISENGRCRMGQPGAANRIAKCLMEQLRA